MNLELKPIEKYFESHDSKYLAEDAVFIHMGNNEETKGRKAIGEMLNFMYNIAFDAHAEVINTIVSDNKALLEANFVGKHIGEFNGIAATQKKVNVPLCVSYELENDLIKTARVYLMSGTLMQQISS